MGQIRIDRSTIAGKKLAWPRPPNYTEEVAIPKKSNKSFPRLIRKPRTNARSDRAGNRTPWSPPLVSLCMIACDEAENIDTCLQSASQDVDEIIVVDTGSRDRTRSIARRRGARVVDFAWRDDFAAARNYGLALATGKWILVLDCDERISPESRGLIRRAAESAAGDACHLRLINVDPQGRQGADWQAIRMFRNSAGVRYRGRIHERPVFSARSTALSDPPLAPGVAIFHHGYQSSAIEQRDKAARNLRLVEKALEEIPENDLIERSLYLFYYGWGSLGPEREQRIRAWVEFVDSHPELESRPVSAWIPAGMAQYAWSLSDQRKHVEAEVRARRVLAKHGASPPLYLAIARARAEAGDYQAAQEALDVLLGPEPPVSEAYRQFPLDLGLVYRRAQHLQAEIAETREHYDEAAKIYAQLTRTDPDHLPPVLRLACVEVQRGRYDEALRVIQANPALWRQGLPEIDCLCLALSLSVCSPDQPKWEERVRDWVPKSELAARFQDQVDSHPAGSDFDLSDFPEIEQGVRVQLPKPE